MTPNEEKQYIEAIEKRLRDEQAIKELETYITLAKLLKSIDDRLTAIMDYLNDMAIAERSRN
jgi:hypothetical protein